MEAIAKETHEGSEEEEERERHIEKRNPTTPAKSLAEIRCDGEIVELKL